MRATACALVLLASAACTSGTNGMPPPDIPSPFSAEEATQHGDIVRLEIVRGANSSMKWHDGRHRCGLSNCVRTSSLFSLCTRIRASTWESCEGSWSFWPRGVRRPAGRHRSPPSNSLLLARAGACGDVGRAVSNTFHDRGHFRRGDRQPVRAVYADLGCDHPDRFAAR
jgi:hypothetical protein